MKSVQTIEKKIQALKNPTAGDGADASRKLVPPIQCVRQTRAEVATYKTFRKLTDQWIGLALQAAQLRLKSTA